MKIVIVNGYSGCGKDTFIHKIGKSLSCINYSVSNTAKCIIHDEYGLDDSCKGTNKEYRYRQLLIDKVNELMQDGTIEREIVKIIDRSEKMHLDILFIHSRDTLVRELLHGKLNKEYLTLWVERDGVYPVNSQDDAASNLLYDIKVKLPHMYSAEYGKVVSETVSFILGDWYD